MKLDTVLEKLKVVVEDTINHFETTMEDVEDSDVFSAMDDLLDHVQTTLELISDLKTTIEESDEGEELIYDEED